ncbi:MAG TPA: site-2 protease family protein [Ktedonobacteraceae bacterium]|nr:site-2 protease family protein [Ktedonobacteraceae bacterium]
MPGSIRLGKIAGIDIHAHLSWFIILVLLTWSLASGWFAQLFPGWATTTYWIAAFISALLLFACVLTHELAHALIARLHGLNVRNITLFIFGGAAHIEEDMQRPGVEFKVAIAGPIASFLLAGAAFLLALPLRGSGASAEAVLDYLTVSNLLLGAFNLFPGFPLDGGRVLRAIVWKVTGNFKKATRIASGVGQASGYLLIFLGIAQFFTGNFFNGLWIVFIGWFLLSAAQSANTQVELQSILRGISASQVMTLHPATVPANISVQKLVDEYFLALGQRAVPVMQGDYLAGLITLTDVMRVPRERWSYTPVGHIMRLLEQIYTATPEQPLQEVLQVMGTQGMNQIPVVEDGRLVGLLSRESIIHYLQVRQSLHNDERQEAA